MRNATLFAVAAMLAFAAPASAQCTGTEGVDFDRVTVREINTIPQANIDQLNAAGASLTTEQVTALVKSPLEGDRVEFSAVILTDPLKSGLATANAGVPGRIHVFMRDLAAETEGVAGMGIQIVDSRGDGSIQGFFAGDQVTVCGEVTYFNSTLQLAPESISSLPNAATLSAATLAPVVVRTGDIHDAFSVDGTTRSQIDWNVFSDFNNQYVRFESVELIQGVQGTNGRPNLLFSTSGDDATVRSYDTSVCFRNDRDETYFPVNQEPACNQTDFTTPATGVVNVQGFLTIAGTFDAFSSSVPPGGTFSISPFEPTDFEIAVAPPIVTVQDTAVPSSTGGASIVATVVPGTAGNTIASVVADYTTSSGASGQITLTNSSGDTYQGTITGLAAGEFVTYTVTATDNQTASSTSRTVSRRVVDGAISSIVDIQSTPDGGVGESGIVTADPIAFDLDAVVQTAFSTTNSAGTSTTYTASIQDDPTLGPFTGIEIFFGDTDPGLEAGDRVTITEARVEERFGLTRLVDVTFSETGTGDPYPAKVVSTVLFSGDDGQDAYEQHEGLLLRFEDVTVADENADDSDAQPTRNFGEFTITSDGGTSAVRVDDASDGVAQDFNTTLTVGRRLESIEGLLTYTFSNFKLLPETSADVMFAVAVGTGPGESTVGITGSYPNPTAGTTRVRFELAAPGEVSLAVFDAMGRQVATVAEGSFGAASHDVSVDLGGLATGVYVLRLEAGGEIATSRLSVIR